jgi:F-type H+-transporting ATPase subunit gamma
MSTCSFNVNVLRAASEFMAAEEAAGRDVELYVLGNKGGMYYGQRGKAMAGRYEAPGSAGVPEYAQVAAFAQRMLDRYGRGDIDGVYVALTRFLSPGRQPNEVVQFLPVPVDRLVSGGEAGDGYRRRYELSPGPGDLLDYLLPAAVKVSMFQALLEAATSEQFTRMISMKNATDSADRLIKALTMRYNRARQSQITTELCEIMGAVEALQ